MSPDPFYLATDLNPKALDVARRTAEHSHLSLDLIQTDLASALLPHLRGKIDILIFNPPYVVTPEDELHEAQRKRGIEASWAGGRDGIEVLLRLLPQALELISETGAFYLLLIEENLRAVVPKLKELFPKLTYLIKRECPGERQIIVRLEKN